MKTNQVNSVGNSPSAGVFPPVDVLMADCDLAICHGVRILFESLGYHVQTVQTVAELEMMLQLHPPRCLVLNAELGGIELLARLRSQGVDVPAIVTSDRGGVPLAVAAMRAGAVDFLEKPILDAHLLQKVRLTLKN